MESRHRNTGIAAITCLVIGALLTATLVAFISVQPGVERAVTREQVVAVIVCLMWVGQGLCFTGFWFGYRVASGKLPIPINPQGSSTGMLAAQIGSTVLALTTLPVFWIVHFQPNFYWWFVFAHIAALCLFLVLALGWNLGTRVGPQSPHVGQSD